MFFNDQPFLAWRKPVALALGLLTLSGCAIKRDQYSVPTVLMPQRYLKSEAVLDKSQTSGLERLSATPTQSLADTLGEWWLLLDSAELNRLIDRVIANNPDLRIATLRLAQLQARMDVTAASALPEINLPVELRNEAPETIGRTRPGSNAKSLKTYQASLRADWRPDLWGEFASQFESSKLQLWRATFQRDDLQRTTIAAVISAYVEYLSLNDRLRVARETDIAISEMLVSVAARLAVGDATAIDYEQQKTAVYQVRATIPVLQQQREVVFNRLSSLAGAMPTNFELSDLGLDSLSFPSVFPGMPSSLLLRRPDVRAVEAQLLAADVDIDLARARALPPLDLTTQIGYGSNRFSEWFEPYSLAWNLIANLSINLFDAGKRSKEIEFSRAVYEEMVETYIRVIYEAAREVDRSLVSIKMMENRMRLQRVSVDAAKQAWVFSQEAYRAGALDYLVILDSERTFTRNLDDWISARQERFQGLVSLFSALGGGVSPGIALPGEGDRPLQLKSAEDGGAMLTSISADVQRVTLVDTRLAVDTPQTMITFDTAGRAITGALNLAVSSSLSIRPQVERIDWDHELWNEPGEHWLVEVTGLFERTAIAPAWRDIQVRFPATNGKVLLPMRLGLVEDKRKERASWYRIYVAHHENQQEAQQLCQDMRARQQRCRLWVARQQTENDQQTLHHRDPVLVEVELETPPAQTPDTSTR